MPTLLQQARFVLDELKIRPHKRFGQHFLIDPMVIARMVEAARLRPDGAVLEIGPGLGALSDTLAGRSHKLYLVEVDEILAEHLRRRFTNDHHVRVIMADFLSLDLATLFTEPTVQVVASLPYNVATPILFHILEHRHTLPQATVMLQKEVAERITAEPGTKSYGVLSVMLQLYATVTTVCTVGPRSFFPAPKVESQVIHLVFQRAPVVTIQNEALFRRVVKAAFAHRRKTLRNALRTAGYSDLDAVSGRVGIDFQRRGETLSIDEFAALTSALAEQ